MLLIYLYNRLKVTLRCPKWISRRIIYTYMITLICVYIIYISLSFSVARNQKGKVVTHASSFDIILFQGQTDRACESFFYPCNFLDRD